MRPSITRKICSRNTFLAYFSECEVMCFITCSSSPSPSAAPARRNSSTYGSRPPASSSPAARSRQNSCSAPSGPAGPRRRRRIPSAGSPCRRSGPCRGASYRPPSRSNRSDGPGRPGCRCASGSGRGPSPHRAGRPPRSGTSLIFYCQRYSL